MQYAEAEGEQLLPLADRLRDLAAEPLPDDDLTPAALLSLAGQYYADAGDLVAAEAVYREAIPGHDGDGLDPRCFLVDVLVQTGRLDEAVELDNALRRSRPADLVTYPVLAQTWIAHDQRRAMGWLNRGLDWAERSGQEDAPSFALLCVARFHLRQDQGQDLDEYDEIAMDLLESDEFNDADDDDN